jgi:hypothetical protein
LDLDEPGITPAGVTFTEFRAADAPMLLAWWRFRDSLVSTHRRPPTRQATDGVSTLWRLLATNNRELGRSFLLYRRFDAARTHVRELQALPDTLTIEYVPGLDKSARGWVVMGPAGPVMTCSRWYSSLSTAAASASRTLEAFESAILADSADRSDASGRFRRRIPGGADVAH